MQFTKMQGAGNDFVLIAPDNTSVDWSELAIKICDRHYGIGADGLLLFLPSQNTDFRMRIFNADGSESNTCGNGLRCMVKYFLDNIGENNGDREVIVETGAGIRKARVHRIKGTVTEIQTAMGKPMVGYHDLDITQQSPEKTASDMWSIMGYSVAVNDQALELALVSMGNKHAVYFSDDNIENFPLAEVGPQIERHAAFSGGINFEIVNIINRHQIIARVWEWGVGETLACGSGASAIAVAAQLLGYVDKKVDIRLPGGVLDVEWDRAGEVLLSGPAETVFVGQYSNIPVGLPGNKIYEYEGS